MVKIGKRNCLEVSRNVDFGVYLTDGVSEILLPRRYVSRPLVPGDKLEVFIYNDSEDRLVATTETPLVEVGEFAFLRVASVNRIGAFLDWGLQKDLLVPFREQKATMRAGGIYPVFVYLDDASKRIVASARVEKFLGNVMPEYKKGDKVNVLVWRETPTGYSCMVDNLHPGMLYSNEVFRPLAPGDRTEAWVMKVRDDGKIDLRLSPLASGRKRTESIAEDIVDRMKRNRGLLDVDESAAPEDIRAVFMCSKRDFKQAIGHLLRDGRVCKSDAGISLNNF